MSMVFSKSNYQKNQPLKTALLEPSQPKPVNTEVIYYMQNSMIGRIMNTPKCKSCPKY